jgi:hypothetical protein
VLDLLVTHLFQVAAEVAMEPPASLRPLGLQAAREQVIKCFRPLDPAEVVPGQFAGYQDVPGVDPPVQPEHLRRRPAVDRQPPLARGAVLPANRQADGRLTTAGQPDGIDSAEALIQGTIHRSYLLCSRCQGVRRRPHITVPQPASHIVKPRST